MSLWDVYLAKVPFEDIDKTKIRPVLIIEEYAYIVSCIKMTSQAPRPGEYVLKKWKEAGLKKETTVRLSKALWLSKDLILKKIGHLHPIDILEIEKRINL